jgi:FkbM family methyltransferase
MFEQLPADAGNFYHAVLSQSIAALKLNTYRDNFDAARFNFDGVDRSNFFDVNAATFNFDWFFKNNGSLFSAYSALDNAQSRRLYLYLIAFRLAGHFSVRLPQPYLDEPHHALEYAQAEKSVESQLEVGGMFGKLRHFDFEFKGERYIADCTGGLEYYLLRNQYFYEVDGAVVRPEIGDYVIDGGACTGDTALVFSNVVKEGGRVYAFDPVAEHLQIMRYNIQSFPYKNVVPMPYGLSDRNVDEPPLVLDKYNPGFRADNQAVPLRRIDSLVQEGAIQRIDFLKLDVEGSEMESLHGVAQSIARFKPKMALSLYHKQNDIFEIVNYVRSTYPFYKLYLGHYTIHAEETVLYCDPGSSA